MEVARGDGPPAYNPPTTINEASHSQFIQSIQELISFLFIPLHLLVLLEEVNQLNIITVNLGNVNMR